MIYLGNPCSAGVREAMRAGLLGHIDTPAQGNTLDAGVSWCADNGCFGKGYPGDLAWLQWLRNHPGDRALCLFATAPDVVGDHAATWERSRPWLPLIREAGYPAALVAQNGMTVANWDHWHEIDCLFLGGSKECLPCGFVWPAEAGKPGRREPCPLCGRILTEWKLGAAARALSAEANARGVWVHMGRVSSFKRLQYAQTIGCDSADGTYLTYGADKNLPTLLGWLAQLANPDTPALLFA